MANPGLTFVCLLFFLLFLSSLLSLSFFCKARIFNPNFKCFTFSTIITSKSGRKEGVKNRKKGRKQGLPRSSEIMPPLLSLNSYKTDAAFITPATVFLSALIQSLEKSSCILQGSVGGKSLGSWWILFCTL